MDSKIQSAQRDADEVKVIMLDNIHRTEDLSQRAEHLQNTDLDEAVKPKRNQKMEYLRANKGLVTIVLISAIIVFAVVVAMLATHDMQAHTEIHSDLEKP